MVPTHGRMAEAWGGVMEKTFQWFSAEAEAAIRKAIEPVATHQMNAETPDAGESYQCESCPADFGFQPEGFKCPICGRGLTGTVTINFYPPQPPDDPPEIGDQTGRGVGVVDIDG